MASSLKNLNEHQTQGLESIADKKIAVLISEYHHEITTALFTGVEETLFKYGLQQENLIKKFVPGAYELTLGAQYMAAKKEIDAVICLGCVIMGETKHFDFICESVAKGLTDVSLNFNIFGVLPPNTMEQAKERAGGKHGNKGVEAAIAAIKMINFVKLIT